MVYPNMSRSEAIDKNLKNIIDTSSLFFLIKKNEVLYYCSHFKVKRLSRSQFLICPCIKSRNQGSNLWRIFSDVSQKTSA